MVSEESQSSSKLLLICLHDSTKYVTSSTHLILRDVLVLNNFCFLVRMGTFVYFLCCRISEQTKSSDPQTNCTHTLRICAKSHKYAMIK